MADQDSNNQVITIDPEVSLALGLGDNFDLDPDEYLQLVREKLAQFDILSASNNITSEQQEEQRLLATKVREIREQKRKGNIKYNTGKVGKKVDKDAFFGTKPEATKEPEKRIVDPSRLLPGTAKTGEIVKYKSQKVEDLKEEKAPEDNKELTSIQKILNSILDTLKNKFKFDQKKEEGERKNKEIERRKKKEGSLEKGFAMVKSAVTKMLAPVQNILDQIWKYFLFTFLGKMFTDLMNWLSDPENKSKIEALSRFLKDWWPLLLGAYLLFGTPLGLFIRGTLSLLGGFTKQILGLLPRLLKLSKSLVTSGPVKSIARAALGIVRSPAFIVPAAAIGTAAILNELTGQRKAAPIQAENKARAQTGRGIGVQGTGTAAEVQGRTSPSPGDMGPTTPYGLLQGVNLGGIVRNLFGYSNGATVLDDGYGGIDNGTGIPITGAGKDTQLIAARPGEVVLTPEDANTIQKTTGFDVYGYVKNRKPSYTNFNKIKMYGQIPLANAGGLVGFNKGGIVGGGNRPAGRPQTPRSQTPQSTNPKISQEDYYALLAISALEDDKPQGRSDVAQSIYNRLYAVRNYGANFNQGSSNTLRSLIVAPEQYEPTFTNRSDWMSINNRQSAAIALMNSKKGRENKWTLNDALRQLAETETAIRNPELQRSSQRHVGGRPFFLGTSQQEHMKPGDVLRDKTHNYFSSWYMEGTPYDKERRNIAAPIPEMLLPRPQSSQPGRRPSAGGRPSGGGNNVFNNLLQGSTQIINSLGSFFGFGRQPSRPAARPGGRPGGRPRRVTENLEYRVPRPPNRWPIDPRGWFGMQGGGALTPVTTTTGIDIPGGRMGADTQFLPQYNVAVQPGEQIFRYVIPKDAADKGVGKTLLQIANNVVGDADSNSSAAKIGFRNRNINIRPPMGGMGGSSVMTLPPISAPSSGGMKGSPAANSQDIYRFSPVLESSFEVRKWYVDMLEIID